MLRFLKWFGKPAPGAASELLPASLRKYVGTAPTGNDRDFIWTVGGSRIHRSFSTLLDDRQSTLRVDEGLFEWIDLFEAIEGAKEIFTMVELGAGYGRWLVAGAVAARNVRNLPVRLIGVEAEHRHFQLMRQHFRDNALDPDAHILIEAAAAETDGPVYFVQGHSREWWGQAILPDPQAGFGDWPEATVATVPGLSLATIMHDVELVDLIDMDIQGAEAAVIRGSQRALSEKVKRVHIGTHSKANDDELVDIFNAMGWHCRNRFGCGARARTDFGEVRFDDGAQTWINPALAR